MEGYLGEMLVDINDTPFKGYGKKDWALYFIEHYGQYDGENHKQWTMDQVARILLGTKVIINKASWANGQFEYRLNLDKPTKKYKKWVKSVKDGEDGPNTYGYNEGVTP
jgi:hypothetical protein